MRKRIKSIYLFPLAFLLIGALFVYEGITKYGFWDQLKGPVNGFHPTIFGVALIVVSIISFFYLGSEEEPVLHRREGILILAGLGTLVLAYLIGVLPACMIFFLFWMKVLEKQPWKKIVIPFLVVFLVVYAAFVWWMQVPFKPGVLVKAILE